EWNGRDDQNRRVASGVYFLKLSGASGTQTRRLVLAR
ncbi:MAG: T9SS type A sorting domain-containing protein, partial [Candidatus Eisenbacteria bacterium]|nr:T9SS type A sorting domain-containing protein [Candidatus Eisenbacteria bacterium]